MHVRMKCMCVCVRRHVCVEPASRLHARTHNAPWLRGDEVGQRSKLLEPLRLARTRKKKEHAEPQHVWHFLFSATVQHCGKRTEKSLVAKTRRSYGKKKDNADTQNVWHFFVSAIGRSKGSPRTPFSPSRRAPGRGAFGMMEKGLRIRRMTRLRDRERTARKSLSFPPSSWLSSLSQQSGPVFPSAVFIKLTSANASK